MSQERAHIFELKFFVAGYQVAVDHQAHITRVTVSLKYASELDHDVELPANVDEDTLDNVAAAKENWVRYGCTNTTLIYLQ